MRTSWLWKVEVITSNLNVTREDVGSPWWEYGHEWCKHGYMWGFHKSGWQSLRVWQWMSMTYSNNTAVMRLFVTDGHVTWSWMKIIGMIISTNGMYPYTCPIIQDLSVLNKTGAQGCCNILSLHPPPHQNLLVFIFSAQTSLLRTER